MFPIWLNLHFSNVLNYGVSDRDWKHEHLPLPTLDQYEFCFHESWSNFCIQCRNSIYDLCPFCQGTFMWSSVIWMYIDNQTSFWSIKMDMKWPKVNTRRKEFNRILAKSVFGPWTKRKSGTIFLPFIHLSPCWHVTATFHNQNKFCSILWSLFHVDP